MTPKESAARASFVLIEAEAKKAIDALDFVPPPVPVGPDASFTYGPNNPPAPLKLRFVAVVGAVKYVWSWGTGTTETHTGNTATNTFAMAGTYWVGLSVTDAAGLTNSTAQWVVVDGGSPVPPIPPPSGEVHAELPRIYIDSKEPTITGQTIHVPIGGDMQAAINTAQFGDVIEPDPSGQWSGNYTFPKKSGSGWITIRNGNMSLVPVAGTRLGTKAALPKFISPNNQGVFTTDLGAHGFRLIGLEIAPAASGTTSLVNFGTSYETTLAEMPYDLCLDRCYLHGSSTASVRRGVTLAGGSTAIIDSRISDIHVPGADNQAVCGWSGPGPYKIVNNYLEAASENIMFGGGDPLIKGLIPSDIEIRRNHITKRILWKGLGYNIKNLFELKNAQRVLAEANVIELVWGEAQIGAAFNLKSLNQGGSAPWSCTRDVTIRLTLVKNTGAGIMLTGLDSGHEQPMERVTITDVLFDGIDVAPTNGAGNALQIASDPIDCTIAHVTFMMPTNSFVTFSGPQNLPPKRLIIRDSISTWGMYGVKSDNNNVVQTIAAYMSDGSMVGNVLIGPDVSSALPGNFFPPTVAAVGFMGPTDYRLAPTSPYKSKATDGRDPGADIDKIMAAIAGVV